LLKIDNNDLYQEAMLGFSDAINSYSSDKNASLKTFISLCTERRVQNFIKKANTKKSRLFSDSLSLDNQISDESDTFINFISDNNKNNPLINLEEEEKYEELRERIDAILSASEKEVYELLICGFNYKDIATLLDKDPKQIDNSIQRIRNKIRDMLKK